MSTIYNTSHLPELVRSILNSGLLLGKGPFITFKVTSDHAQDSDGFALYRLIVLKR